MTNEEKAREIGWIDAGSGHGFFSPECYYSAKEAMEWKDKQHSTAFVVTRCEEMSDYVEKVFFDKDKAQEYCDKYNSNEGYYYRQITEIETTL